jgi:hypothetical protein
MNYPIIVNTVGKKPRDKIYPISFSIPKEKIVSHIPEKTKLLATIIPGKPETYIYGNSEIDYYIDYRRSIFGMTTKKAGWDCMRHYEIMANGCIPYFPDLTNCPIETMTTFPKDLILEGNRLYEKYKTLDFAHIQKHYRSEYECLIQRILEFVRIHLTTESIARMMIEKTYMSVTPFPVENTKSNQSISFISAHEEDILNEKWCKKILFLSGSLYPDYLRCLTLHGLKQLFGSNCHDYPRIPHMYTDYVSMHENRELYGNGFSYSRLLAPELHDYKMDETVETDIQRGVYDMVIYGSLHRGLPMIELVLRCFPKEKVVFLCGEDIHQNGVPHKCPMREITRDGHSIFIRELGDIGAINPVI